MKGTYIIIGVVVVVAGLYFVFDRANAPATTTTTGTQTSTMDSKTITTPEGLQITDEVVGTGTEAKPGNMVTVQYVGMLENGTVFDASRNHGDTGFTFALDAGRVIRGWDIGIEGMKVGGKRKLIIPPSLAYGDQAVGGVIPPNSTLIFEVELIKVIDPGGIGMK